MIKTSKSTFDLCIYGGTASGMMAAIAAARRGHTVAIIEPSRWLGGMIGGGIRITTDCEYPLHTGGLTRELLLLERTHQIWNQDGGQHLLRKLWQKLAAQHQITIIYEHRVSRVIKKHRRIEQLILDNAPPQLNGTPAATPTQKENLSIHATVFIDASYEGDLMALAGVNYTTGRESKKTYGESLAGIRNIKPFAGIDPYKISGDAQSGLLPVIPTDPLGHEGDASRHMIPFNFRHLRAFQSTDMGIPAPLPQQYSPEHKELVNRIQQAGHLGWCRGNFNRRSLIDGSLPGIQSDYPDGNWATRADIWHTLIQNDLLVSQASQRKIRLFPEMYPDTKGWPHQLYIRMARRMLGQYIITQHDLMLQTSIHDPIGLGYYNVDIYPCRLVVLNDGTLATEGETWELLSPGPYQIPYRALTPERDECSNLLVSVCISASHVACASIRMEPTFMIMGESAGIAASLSIEQQAEVQNIGNEKLQKSLLGAHQILTWDGEGYGSFWFNKPFVSWWQKHPEEYDKRPVQNIPG